MPPPPSACRAEVPPAEPAGTRRPPGRAETAELLRRHGLVASRALGQNFLVEPGVAERIARCAALQPGERVVEVGPGLGALTVALAATGARVTAVELDRHLLGPLEEVVAGLGVTLVHADAMEPGWRKALGPAGPADPGAGWVLVANLPYNIATPLVLDLLREEPAVHRMVVMVQREVAERLVASPGSSRYGAVSVRLSYFATARIVMRVPPAVFLPRPKVDSAVVEVVRRAEPGVDPAKAPFAEIDELVGRAFSHRRKMLRRSLAGVVAGEQFAAAGIDPSRRPEELGLEEWGRLAAARRAGGPR
ncbi:MAG TPA: 16S rRNA (adenine(1518)-N(6)/adenine(1519)-N(6))-dimethyltransferase RsmA [Acidimicrobiales bacterium]|nr:16S rRNA (adenine(1518)-N(6)/adenine(1519)-N(6))-dimethyltransferase RsmA [Acidimicrobiales bacterium]